MTWAYYPVAGCGESRSLGSEREGSEAIPSSTPNQLRREITARIEQHLTDYLAKPIALNQSTAEAIRIGLLDIQEGRDIERHLWQQYRVFALAQNLDDIYFGYSQGGFVGVTPDGGTVASPVTIKVSENPQKSGIRHIYSTDNLGDRQKLLSVSKYYDASQRPWYKAAVQTGQATWGEIYTDFLSWQPAITISQPVYDSTGTLQGVLGIDLLLSQIGEFLQGLEIGRSGETFIIERSGLLVASSTSDQPALKSENIDEVSRLRAIDSGLP